MENKELFELEKELLKVDKDLEKEKVKRNLILISIHTVIAGCISSWFIDMNSLKAALELIVIALLSGIALWIVPLLIFQLVTKLFTNVDSAEARKKHLAKEIENIRQKH